MPSSTRLPILVAVGDSDTHDAALRFAVHEALRDGLRLRLVHVVHPPNGVLVPEQMLISFQAAQIAAQDLLRQQAARVAALSHGRVEVDQVLRRGGVVDGLVELSRTGDHIVLQHRQQARMLRVFTGSVCAGVAGEATVPVVSVPELWTETATHRVLVGLDGPTGNDSLLEHAFREAEAREARLTVLHAWYLPSMYDDAVVDRAALQEWRELAREQIGAQVEPFSDAHPSVAVRIVTPHMRAADALVEESGQSDLLFVGRRTAARGLMHLGPVSRAMVRETRCPVVVVAPDAVATGAGGTGLTEQPVAM